MIRTYRRPADPTDLRVMTSGRGSPVRNLLTTSLPLALVLAAIVFLISRSWVVATTVAVVLFGASAVSNARYFGAVRRREAAQAQPDAVEVLEVQASRVWDIEPLGSHGPAWVFFAGERKAVLLMGQWLLADRTQPSLAFRLHRWADSQQPIRFEATGPDVEAEEQNVQFPATYRGSDVEVFDATPETLQQDLERTFGRSEPPR